MPKGRRKKYRKKTGVHATPAGWAPKGSGETRDSVVMAAEVFAARARLNASFSKRIAEAISVAGFQHEAAMITASAPQSVSFEFGQKHPLNYPNQQGSPNAWGPTPKRPFMDRAARSKRAIKKAAEVYSTRERELIAMQFGFTDSEPT